MSSAGGEEENIRTCTSHGQNRVLNSYCVKKNIIICEMLVAVCSLYLDEDKGVDLLASFNDSNTFS